MPSIVADPNAALKQARQVLASDPAAAASQARQLLQSHPANPAVLRLLGAALRKLGKAKDAAKVEKEAIDASARNPAHREAARLIASGDKQRAMTILGGLLDRDENDVVALVMFGLQLSADGELEMAETLLRRAAENAPNDVPARLALVEHLHRARRASDALQLLDEMGADGQAVAARSLRANVLRDLGRQEEEVEILEQLAA